MPTNYIIILQTSNEFYQNLIFINGKMKFYDERFKMEDS